MTVCTPISTCSKDIICLIGNVQRRTVVGTSNTFQHSLCYDYIFRKYRILHYTTTYPCRANSCSPINGFQAFQKRFLGSCTAKHGHSLTFKRSLPPRQYQKMRVTVSCGNRNMDLSLFVSKQSQTSEIKCDVGPFSFKHQSLWAGIFIGLLVCFSTYQRSFAEAHEGNEKRQGYRDASSGDYSHNKKVVRDYSVIGIPGDGRCLFRSVAHGACTRLGKPAPHENLQRELADELRDRIADEFIKRRNETEWFIEGDFETYVSQIRKPHVWGGEPELLMASHVLQMPITVYMHDQDSGGLISVAEYGQEYGKENPIKVLYHGYGHYDALHVFGRGARGRL